MLLVMLTCLIVSMHVVREQQESEDMSRLPNRGDAAAGSGLRGKNWSVR